MIFVIINCVHFYLIVAFIWAIKQTQLSIFFFGRCPMSRWLIMSFCHHYDMGRQTFPSHVIYQISSIILFKIQVIAGCLLFGWELFKMGSLRYLKNFPFCLFLIICQFMLMLQMDFSVGGLRNL